MSQRHTKEITSRNQMLDCVCTDGIFILSNSATQQLSNSATQQLSNNCALKLLSLFLSFFFVSTLVGCSLDASIQSLSNSITEVFSKPTMAEITPSSSQNSYSTRGYQVQVSVSYQDSAAESTTARGFKTYTSVQGTILKE